MKKITLYLLLALITFSIEKSFGQSPQAEFALEVSMYSDAFPTGQKCKIFPFQLGNCSTPASQCEVWGCVNSPFYVSYIHPEGDDYVQVNALNGNPELWNSNGQFFSNPFYYDSNYPSWYANTPAPHSDISFFQYSTPGVYTIHYTLFDQAGNCLAYIEYTIHVIGGSVTNPLISIQPNPICINELTNISTGLDPNTHTFHWIVQNPNNTVVATSSATSFHISGVSQTNEVGTYTVTLFLDDECEGQTFYEYFEVTNLMAEISFHSHDCNEYDFGATLTCFVNTATYTYSWSINDITTSSTPEYSGTGAPWNNVSLPNGTYNVTVIVNGSNGSTTTVVQQIVVNNSYPPIPTFTPSVTSSCEGETEICIQNPNTNYTYSWTASNSTSGTTSCATVNFYPVAGDITFIVTDPNSTCSITANYHVWKCCPSYQHPGPDPVYTTLLGDITVSDLYTQKNTMFPSNFLFNGTTYTINLDVFQFTFNGALIIDAPTIITNSPMMDFGGAGSVQVLDTKTLLIKGGSILQHGCDEMWQGLNVHPIGDLEIQDATVKDAIIAINSDGGGNFTLHDVGNGGPTLDLNWTNIRVVNFNDNHPATIENSTITESATLALYPHANDETRGMDIRNVKHINVGSTLNGNSFNDLTLGIQLFNSSIDLKSNSFTNILADYSLNSLFPQKGYAIADTAIGSGNPLPHFNLKIGSLNSNDANSFSNCSNGFAAFRYVNTYCYYNLFNKVVFCGSNIGNKYGHIDITNNFVTNSTIGFSCFNNTITGINISSNNISVTPIFIFGSGIYLDKNNSNSVFGYPYINSNTISNSLFDIVNLNTKYSTIASNVINFYASTGGFGLYTSGIRAEYSDGIKVKYNTINSTMSALTNPFTFGTYSFHCSKAVWQCNTIYNVGRSMLFDNVNSSSSVTGNWMLSFNKGIYLRNSGIIGDQGNDALHITNFNHWTPAIVSRLVYDGSDGNLSHFTYVSGSNYNPNPVTNPNFGILNSPTFLNTTISTDPCPAQPHIDIEKSIDSTFFSNLLKDSTYNFPRYSEQTRWMIYLNSMKYLRSDSANYNWQNDSSIYNFYISNFNSSIGKIAKVDSLAKDGDIDNARLINESIISSSILEENIKIVNEIEFGQFDSTSILNDNEIETLIPIANTCPFIGGPAVIIARSLLRTSFAPNDFRHYKIYNDDSLCEAQSGYRNEVEEDSNWRSEELTLNLFPNPATDEINISYYSPDLLSASFELYDLEGRIIFERKIYSILSDQNIKLPSLASGVYVYKVKKTDLSIAGTGKLVIVK